MLVERICVHVLYEDPFRKERIEVKTPVEMKVDIQKLRVEAGIPDYLDTADFQSKKLVAAIWISRHISQIDENIHRKRNGAPISTALFGGAAFRLHCPSLNKRHTGLYRSIKDIDILVSKKDGQDFASLLCRADETLGNMFLHRITYSDKQFNLMRAGERYRLTTISDVGHDGVLVPGILEIFADKLTFCHEFVLTDEIKQAHENYFTVGIENLILLKTQFIKRIPRSELSSEYEYRVMGDYDKSTALMGMEDKDMRNVAAAVLDHEIGKGPDRLNIDKLGVKLLEDWKLWKTCTMNLTNIYKNLSSVMKKFAVSQEDTSKIHDRLGAILDALNTRFRPKKPFLTFSNKQWWQDVEEQQR